MYSKLVLVCLVVAFVGAAPPTDVVPLEKQQPTVIPIVSQSEELESNGTYKFSYETGNGIKREETSYDKVLPKVEGRSAAGDSNEGGESDESNEVHVQQGSYSYTAPDGTLISVRYIADENGFRPIGDHIPPSIVAAAAAAGSSGEKSGRALNVADSADSASAPKSVAAPGPKPKAAPAPESKEPETAPKPKKSAAPESAPVEPSESSTTEAGKTAESEATESTSEAVSSTTEAGTTSTSSEATDASEASTPAEATTKADATATAASEEPSSTSADASTTEAASTSAA